MPPTFHTTPVAMSDDMRDERRVFRWALPASLVVHLVIAAFLIFGLPVSLSEPQKDQAISVDLVPPPKPPEKPKPEPPSPAEAPKPDNQIKPQPPTSKDAARPSPALRPVYQFGEKDVGPRESRDGNSAEEGSKSPATSRDPDKQDRAQPPALAVAGTLNQAPQGGEPETPAPKPADAAKEQKSVKLEKAKTLFSRAATGDPVAATAMGSLPRGERVRRLCATELGQQLLHASPPYFPDRLPSYRLNGRVLEISRDAFHASGQWYNLSFRCEVDADATKVVSFAFGVGDPVPRREWKSRGLPSE
jgi:uncharacterized protein DUF930